MVQGPSPIVIAESVEFLQQRRCSSTSPRSLTKTARSAACMFTWAALRSIRLLPGGPQQALAEEPGKHGPNPTMPTAKPRTRHSLFGQRRSAVEFRRRITTEDNKNPRGHGRTQPSFIGTGRSLPPCRQDIMPTRLAVRNRWSRNPRGSGCQAGSPRDRVAGEAVVLPGQRAHIFIEPSVAERTIEEWQEWVPYHRNRLRIGSAGLVGGHCRGTSDTQKKTGLFRWTQATPSGTSP